ncbi:minor capsid protein [Thermoactinomyces sp. DSM 45892]|uniref:minor capsid protein n=1 Tax=Thermoactinomyces sp. DSM 45892 TaxID=1882753 RepID=UPI00089A2790|nr:minor capsid protein [Thermoactinomyces sp. DSM 45892]SDZ05185.1 hypothetical protein SAMN05444416_11284 [Thermoactinomyces sp. DSM 45892]
MYYPFLFPTTSEDECCVVSIHSGMPENQYTRVQYPSFQLLIRGKPNALKETEGMAYHLYEVLANKREQTIGESSIVVIRSESSSPIFLGTDEANRPIFSLNFGMVVRP